jgi:hypothetical protein
MSTGRQHARNREKHRSGTYNMHRVYYGHGDSNWRHTSHRLLAYGIRSRANCSRTHLSSSIDSQADWSTLESLLAAGGSKKRDQSHLDGDRATGDDCISPDLSKLLAETRPAVYARDKHLIIGQYLPCDGIAQDAQRLSPRSNHNREMVSRLADWVISQMGIPCSRLRLRVSQQLAHDGQRHATRNQMRSK